jgi:hypothetical protein
MPGARVYAFAQVDAFGLLWLFGGQGYDSAGAAGGFLSDLWRFDGVNWTWMAGPNVRNQPGIHGTLGIPSAANVPGGRSAGSKGMTWITPSEDLWILGAPV